MGFGYLIAGFLFLINPVIHVIDILPDCIGFWFIVKGLSKTAMFVDKLSEAKRHFWKLALIDLVKVFSILLWPYVSDSAMLLLAFVFSILELMYFIPAMINLFDGLHFAALWYQGDSVFLKKLKYRRRRNEEGKYEKTLIKTKEYGTIWRNHTIFFYSFRILLTVLPELTSLQLYDNLGSVTAVSIEYSYYKPLFYILFALILFIVSIFWIVRTIRYLGGIRKDAVFQDALKRKYTEDILPNKNLFTAITMKRVLLLFTAAIVTSLVCIVDGVNLMVGVISASCLLYAGILLGKTIRLAYLIIPLSVIRILLSIYNLVLQIQYFDNYSVSAVEWVTNAYKQYYFMASMEVFEYIIAMAAMVFFIFCLMRAVRVHLESVGIQTENTQFSKRNHDLEIYNMIGSRLLFNAVLALINYIICCIYPYAIVYVSVMLFILIAVMVIWITQTVFTVMMINQLIYDRLADNY